MKRIIITGANGLIGSSTLPLLLEENEVYALVRDKLAFRRREHDNLRLIEVDLGGEWNTNILPQSADAVIHLAQSPWFREFPGKASHVFNVNTSSTMRLLDYSRQAGVKHFIYGSSGGIYGTGDGEFNEESPAGPSGNLGFYLGSKLCSEIIANSYNSIFNVIILRFFFVYGAIQRRDMLIPRLVDSVHEGKKIFLDGIDGIRINPIHVSDAARAVAKSIELNSSLTINVGGNEIMSLRKICSAIGSKIGKQPVFENSAKEGRNLLGDIRKMVTIFGEPNVRFSDGVEELIRDQKQ